MAVDAAVADAEGACDIDDVRFRRAVAAEDVFGGFQDSLGGQCFGRHRSGSLAPLAVQDRHLLGLVARAGGCVGRDRLLDLRQVVGAELDVERAERLGEPLAAAGADERDDVVPARERPGDRELRDGRSLGLGDSPQRLDEGEVALEVLAREPGRRGAEVVRA